MTRLALLPDNQFSEDFKQLRRDIEAIKNPQRFGRDSIRPRIVQCLDSNGNPTLYDIVTDLSPPLNEFQIADYTAILHADTQLEPWATMYVQFYYGSPTNPAVGAQATGGAYLSQGATGDGTIAYRGRINGQYLDLTTIYAKFYMFATDTGTLEVRKEYIE